MVESSMNTGDAGDRQQADPQQLVGARPPAVTRPRYHGAISRPASRGVRQARGTMDVWSLRFGDLWRFFKAQGLAFWAMCFYLVVEYVRPQQLIPYIDGLPLGQIVLGL